MATKVVKQTTPEENVLADRGYKLGNKLGEGGYAKVFSCEFSRNKNQKTLNLACKLINTDKAPPRYRSKFLPRELKVLMILDHPHIIQVHSIFQHRDKTYIFMRLAEKGDLLDYVVKHGPIKQAQCRVWVRQIALGIQYLHVMEIAHRDLKCENILITAHNNVKISDFGFSRCVLDDDNRRVMSETYCGSLSYAPPEILKGEPYNPKPADLWSFGVLIYTMLNKTSPFDSKNVKLLYEQQVEKKWKFRPRYIDLISEECKTLITHLLEPNPYDRYKIEQVINSEWIAKDPKLKKLNSREFFALQYALDESRSVGISGEPHESPRGRALSLAMKKFPVNHNSLEILKEYNDGFDLQLIKSEFHKIEGRLSQ